MVDKLLAGTEKSRKRGNASSKRANHWQNIPRDKNGRWVKQKKKKQGSSATKKPSTTSSQSCVTEIKKKPSSKSTKSKVITPSTTLQSSNAIDVNAFCPRCGGDMHQHRIRCGPERLVSVKKCEICNFWLPIPTSTANQVAT